MKTSNCFTCKYLILSPRDLALMRLNPNTDIEVKMECTINDPDKVNLSCDNANYEYLNEDCAYHSNYNNTE